MRGKKPLRPIARWLAFTLVDTLNVFIFDLPRQAGKPFTSQLSFYVVLYLVDT